MHKNLEKSMECVVVAAGTPLAVACSGGPDSMALALLAAKWCKKSGSALTAITVDHGIRRGSAKEARQAAAWLGKQGISHVTLTWEGKKPARNIQEEARKARYKLMAEYCLANNIHHLLVAHTQEDQAETFLLRLARGSGVDGLACMQPETSMYGITILRPLLNIPKAELISYLKEQKQKFIKDPSNRNNAYDRVRMRKALPMLAKLGLTVERLTSTATTMARARTCLEAETAKVMAISCTFFPEGYALLHKFTAPDEITLRVLSLLVMTVGGHEVRPRLADVERLQAMVQDTDFKGATLGGCQFIAHKGNILICREPSAVAANMPAKNGVWDRRFTVECVAPKAYTIGALTQEGWLALAKEKELISPYQDKKILYTLPALRDPSGKICAVPHLGVQEKDVLFHAEFTASKLFPGIFLGDH